MTSEQADFYEFKYPYVLPETAVVDTLSVADMSTLTPLENAFVLWHIETGNARLSISRLVHPAHYFDDKELSGEVIISRPAVREVLAKLRKNCPFLRVYTVDHLAGLLHHEVEYLCKRGRDARYRDRNGEYKSALMLGKKTPQELEMAEITILLQYVAVLRDMTYNMERLNRVPAPGTQSRDEISRIDRIIAEAAESINRAEARANADNGNGASKAT